MPGTSVEPPSSLGIAVAGVWPAALSKAVPRAACAPSATGSATCEVPCKTISGGPPVRLEPGEIPMSPVIVVVPVLVMVWPARTTKGSALPSGIGVAAAWALPGSATSSPRAATEATLTLMRRALSTYRDSLMSIHSLVGTCCLKPAGDPTVLVGWVIRAFLLRVSGFGCPCWIRAAVRASRRNVQGDQRDEVRGLR